MDGFLGRGGGCGPQEHEVLQLRQENQAVGVVVGVELVVVDIDKQLDGGDEEESDEGVDVVDGGGSHPTTPQATTLWIAANVAAQNNRRAWAAALRWRSLCARSYGTCALKRHLSAQTALARS